MRQQDTAHVATIERRKKERAMKLSDADQLAERIRREVPHTEVTVREDVHPLLVPDEYESFYVDVNWLGHRRMVMRSVQQWQDRAQYFQKG